MWAKPLPENAKIPLPGDVRRSKRLCFSFLPFGSSLLMSAPQPDHLTVFGLFSRGHFGNQYFLLLQTTPLTAAFVEWVDFLYIQLGKSISLAKWSCRVFNRSYSSFAIPREAVHTIMHNTVVVVRDEEGVYLASVVFVEVVWLAWSRE